MRNQIEFHPQQINQPGWLFLLFYTKTVEYRPLSKKLLFLVKGSLPQSVLSCTFVSQRFYLLSVFISENRNLLFY